MPHPQPNPHAEMSFVEHLEELRWRLIWAIATLAIGCGVGFAFNRQLLTWLTRPAPHVEFIFTAPGEYFMASLKIAFFAGLYLALPMILYQGISFVAPGLAPQERRWVIPVTLGAFVLFTVGGAFAYFALLPAGLHFLLGLAPDAIAAKLSIGTYLGFTSALIFAAGFIFQLPIVLLALAVLGIVSSDQLKRLRRVAIVASLALGAVLSPSADLLSQLMLAGALVVLYELSIVLSRAAGR